MARRVVDQAASFFRPLSPLVAADWMRAAGRVGDSRPAAATGLGELRHRHVEHDRLAELGQCRPVGRRATLLGAMAGGQHDGMVGVARGRRDAGQRRAGQTRRQSGNNPEADAGLGQCEGLVPTAAEHEGIAALQPQHAPAGAGALDQHLVDVALLRDGRPPRLPAATLGAVAASATRGDDQALDESSAWRRGAAQQRWQRGIAGACARQPDLAGREVWHAEHSWESLGGHWPRPGTSLIEGS